MSIFTINNTNGYNTRKQTIVSNNSTFRIADDLRRLIHEYFLLKNYQSVRQCSIVHKLYILLNANIGTLFAHGKLSQNTYISAVFIRKNFINQYGYNHKRARFAIKQIDKFCQIYEAVCLSDNYFIPRELFQNIFYYISNL